MEPCQPREGEERRDSPAPGGKARGSRAWLWGFPAGALLGVAFLVVMRLLIFGSDNPRESERLFLEDQSGDDVFSLESETYYYDATLNPLNRSPADEETPTDAVDPAKGFSGELSGEFRAREGSPAEIETASDLYGCWETERGFVSSMDGQSVYHRICFDESKNATSYSAELINGEAEKDCRVKATAEITETGFTVAETIEICPGWMAGVFDCRLTSPGAARCLLRLSWGLEEQVDFKYAGKTETF